MPATESPALIVARFLKANHYNDTLDAFLREAGLPPDAGSTNNGGLTIERILEEKQVFDLSLRFEKLGSGDDKAWNGITAPSEPHQVPLPTAANILHVSLESFEDEESAGPRQLLLATTADRRLNLIIPDSTFTISKSVSHLHDSPILSCIPVGSEYLTTISSGMSGQVLLYDHDEDKVLDERRDHNKYVVKVDIWTDSHVTWVATAGWDAKVYLYRMSQEGKQRLGAPVASITLTTNPETIKFVQHPDHQYPILIVTRRDSTSLYYYSISPRDRLASTPVPTELELLGSQNLAPHSNAWIAFSPSSVAVCPTDPTLLAVATSAVPHMKLILVRLLIPLHSASDASSTTITQASQARASLATQDREDAAIKVHVNTLAPQTPYSTPQVVWRPDGSGLWVNGDDGVLRGLEAKTGKVVAILKGGHEAGSKIRSIWCGMVEGQEWVVSGGFDRRLVVWKPGEKD